MQIITSLIHQQVDLPAVLPITGNLKSQHFLHIILATLWYAPLVNCSAALTICPVRMLPIELVYNDFKHLLCLIWISPLKHLNMEEQNKLGIF